MQSQKKISRKDAKKRQDFLLNHFITRERSLDARDPALGISLFPLRVCVLA